MCGIVGYVGGRPALGIVLDGLRRLEYRGYDSAGVAICRRRRAPDREAGRQARQPGEGARPRAAPPTAIATGTTGIGHTRWATHGGPTDRNAHPHLSRDGRVAVIHNGIIENFAKLRAELEADGVEFASDTDTECAAHLLAAELTAVRAGGVWTVPRRSPRRCGGSAGGWRARSPCSPPTRDVPGAVVGARRNSPLVVGRGERRELPRQRRVARSSSTPARPSSSARTRSC